MRTNPWLDTLSFDDLYNNLIVFERDVKDIILFCKECMYASLVLDSVQFRMVQLDYDDLEQINDDDTKEMDLEWQGILLETAELKGTKTAKEEMLCTMETKLDNEALKENEDLKTKFENRQNSSKNLSKLLNTQMSANDKFGLGKYYNPYIMHQAPKVPYPEPSPKHMIPLSYNDPLPGGMNSLKLKELMELCTHLSNKVLQLENEVIDIKSTYKERIKKLKGRVDRLEEENKVLKELHSVHSKVDTVAPVVEKEKSFKQGRIIRNNGLQHITTTLHT
nr:hypothetical protein [Tanacetum cinerariifolium]